MRVSQFFFKYSEFHYLSSYVYIEMRWYTSQNNRRETIKIVEDLIKYVFLFRPALKFNNYT